MKVGVKWPHSDPCVAFVSCQPFSLQGQTLCSSAYMCVMNETGAFFSSPAFLFGERINTALYKMVAGDLRFHSLSQHLCLWPEVGPCSDWCLFNLLSSRRASLHCQARVCLDKFSQRRISLWCVLFHAIFVFLSVCAQAHSLYYVVYQFNFSRDIARFMLFWLTFSESKCSNMALNTVSLKKSGLALRFVFALKLMWLHWRYYLLKGPFKWSCR